MVENLPAWHGVNVKQDGDHYAIVATGKGRLTPLLWITPLFLIIAFAAVRMLYNEIVDPTYSHSIAGYLMIIGGTALFGYLTFSMLISLIRVTEVVLVPEKRTIVVRRERTKRVVSEHAADDIEIRHERVRHEDPSRTSRMHWFTLYDTRREKEIFSIRPGEYEDLDAQSVNELEEFFKAVMYPQQPTA
jgi:hypothetical protein